MDEILVANFMVFHDVVREDRYDLWIADEGWEIDYYLHEHPGEKRAHYAWLTDFVGWLPMPDGAAHEAALTADYNAEMVEHVARHPQVRDRALFVGNADDVVRDRLGPELPLIRDWTADNFDFVGYVSGFDPATLGDRSALRAQLGYGDDERVCLVTVGGSGVGEYLLRRVIDAFPEARERVPDLRMIVVAGPRIDPELLPQVDGLEVRAYVHQLYRHLAACDLADRPGRADHGDGAHGGQAPLPVLPPAPPLRADLPRAASPRPLPGGAADGHRDGHARRDRGGHRRRDRPPGRLPRRGDRRRRPGRGAAGGDAARLSADVLGHREPQRRHERLRRGIRLGRQAGGVERLGRGS